MSRALYKILVDDILRKISSGEIVVGTRLPPEAEYAESLGVSRSTLRQAFGRLEQSGIIRRRKRGGTEVIASTPIQRFNMATNDVKDVLSLAQDTLMILTDIREVEPSMVKAPANLNVTVESWLVCTASRYLVGQANPFCEVVIYVPKHYADINLQVGDTTNSVLFKIESRYGVAVGRVKREISAGVCCADMADKLGLTAGDAILTILTEVHDEKGVFIEFAEAVIDPARFNLTTDVVVDD